MLVLSLGPPSIPIPNPDNQPNVRLVTVALRVESRIAYHTERLDTYISNSDMEQPANKATEAYTAALVNGADSNNTSTQQQPQQLLGSS